MVIKFEVRDKNTIRITLIEIGQFEVNFSLPLILPKAGMPRLHCGLEPPFQQTTRQPTTPSTLRLGNSESLLHLVL
jgi:hypothetical protein